MVGLLSTGAVGLFCGFSATWRDGRTFCPYDETSSPTMLLGALRRVRWRVCLRLSRFLKHTL